MAKHRAHGGGTRGRRPVEGREEVARVDPLSEVYGCTHGDPRLEARSGVEAMSLGPESLTRTLCHSRYRSRCETIMAQTRYPTA
jgi:hypothetical protein